MFNRRPFLGVAALAAASIGIGPVLRTEHHMGRTRYPAGYKPRKGYYFKPHNGEREIARRLRQAERNAEKRRDRCVACNGFGEEGQIGLSRRGNVLVERDGRIMHLDGRIVA